MRDPAKPVEPVLRIAHRATLAALALSALATAALPSDATSNTPDRRFTVAAIALSIGAIGCHQGAIAGARNRARFRWLSLCRFVFAAALGALAIALVGSDGPRQVALLYTLAGAMLALRPAATPATRASTD